MERSSKPLVDWTIGQLSRSWLLFHRNRLLQLTFFNELNWLTRPLGTKKNLNKTKTSISFVLNRGQMTLQWLEQGVECVDSIYRWSLPPRRWTRSDRKYHAHGIKKKIEQKDEEKRINIYEKKKKKESWFILLGGASRRSLSGERRRNGHGRRGRCQCDATEEQLRPLAAKKKRNNK